ncbi:hypothetical protein C9E89_003375 [Acinetobacter sichuanensis]|uniref:Uncharacterized protein n=1 Tax=Acinetobacter sichuanensis TaxID=2136183 RepID=A0A371YU40_9GAMM|nr:hypothetical protein C9E89_003375 [Acinetobacter sichuanensis]
MFGVLTQSLGEFYMKFILDFVSGYGRGILYMIVLISNLFLLFYLLVMLVVGCKKIKQKGGTFCFCYFYISLRQCGLKDM